MQPLGDASIGWPGLGAAALWQLLDRLRIGVVVLDAVGAVLGRNAAAHDLLGAGDALVEREGVLEVAGALDRETLRRFLDAVCTPGGPSDGRALAIPRGDKRRPIELMGVSLERPETPSQGPVPAALLLVHDPDLPTSARREHLMRDLYRLTPAEARVAAALLEGRTVDETSAALGLSRHTVRTHVKHVLAKTSARSQTELVRRVLCGPLGLFRALSLSRDG